MAAITFHINNFGAASTGDPTLIHHGEGSGLGFYGGGFGISVPVGQFQDTTFVTNTNGTTEGVRGNNTKYMSMSGVSFNGADPATGTSGIPNYYAPLRIRFNHSEAVSVQNCKLRIFDRNDISNHASGVTTQVYEVRHPYPVADVGAGMWGLTLRGTDDVGQGHAWQEFDPTLAPVAPQDMVLTSSPGVSGLNTESTDPASTFGPDGETYNWLTNDGTPHKSLEHDWYIALSASPQGIGSKTDYGLYMTLEYL